MQGATLLTLTSSSTLDRSRYLRSQISSGYIATRLHRHSASAPGATLLTLTSSSTLDRSHSLRSQFNSYKSNDGRQQLKWTSSYSTFHIDKLIPQFTWTSSTQLFTLTSSSHQSTWTSSTQLFTLTSSSLSSHGRALLNYSP